MDSSSGAGGEIVESRRKALRDLQPFRIHKKGIRIQNDVHRERVTDVQAADEGIRGRLDFVCSDDGELSLTARVDGDDDAFDDVRLSTKQRLEFLDDSVPSELRIASILATCL